MNHEPARYRIVAALGQGTFGTTYEAEDLTTYKRVALKVLSLKKLTDWKALELFEREAKVLSNLNHAAIPKYLDYYQVDTEDDRQFYLVQELIEGESLAQRLEKGWRPDEKEVRRIAQDVLEILKYLHAFQPPVIHRDIKPQNILRRADGKIFLVDFGAVQDVYRNTITCGGTFVGTLGYMPAEQLQGKVEPASDLYSLGATLLFLLIKKSPDLLPQRRLKIDFRNAVKISSDFADWLEKMLEPVVEDRFPSAKAAQEALQSGRGNISPPRLIRPYSLPYKREKPSQSCIMIFKAPGYFMVEMPPIGLNSSAIFILGFFSIWSGIPSIIHLSIIFNSIATGQVTSAIFYLLTLLINPFFLIGMGLITLLFNYRSYLKIDQKKFEIGWNYLCFSKKIQGQSEDIEMVELKVNVNSKRQKTSYCVLWEGVNERKFGTYLTQDEQEWLVEEVTDFLTQLRETR